MDRGGTITWILDADDSKFERTIAKVREEARLTGDSVDRDFDKGFGRAEKRTSSLADTLNGLRNIFSSFRRETSKPSNAFSEFDNGLRNIKGVTVALPDLRKEFASTGRSLDTDIKGGTDSARNSLADFRQDLSRSANLFRNFQVVLRGFTMTAIIIGVTTAGGAIIELVGALTAAMGAFAAIPGVAAPIIGAFGAIKIATLGMEDAFKALAKGDAEKLAEALKGLSPAAQEFVLAAGRIRESFKPIQQAVQEEFFKGLGKQMELVAQTSFPMLRKGLVDISKEMNGLLLEAARVAREPFFQGMIAKTLETTAQSTNTLKGAIEPLAQAVSGLVTVGLPYTNMLADWIVKQSKVAATYVNSADGQRELTQMINAGISALGKLLDLAGSVASLFVSLFNVSNKEGISFIDTLTKIVDQVNAWVNSAEGQKLLQSLFEVTNEIFVELAKTVGTILVAFLKIIDAFNNMDGPLKDVVVQFLIWSAILSPVLTYLSSVWASMKLVGLVMREVLQFVGLWGPFTKGLKAAQRGLVTLVKTTVASAISISKAGAKAAGGWIASAAKASAAWVVSAAKVSVAWVGQMARIVASMAVTSVQAVGHAIATAAIWVAQAIRVAAVWTAQMAIVAAQQFWAGLQAQSPALASGIVWTIQAVKVAAAWTANMAVVVAQWAVASTKAAGHAIVAGAQWLAQPILIAAAWVRNMAAVVASTAATGAKTGAHAITAAAKWIAQPVLIGAAWAKNLAKAAATSLATGGKMAGHALIAGTAWVKQAALASGAWLLQFAKMIPFMLGTAVGMAANAVIASASWIAGAVAVTAAWIIANAAILGLWGLIILAIIAAVALIIANWDKIVGFFKTVWEGILTGVSAVVEWIKTNWPLLLAILTGPIGIAVLLITKNWDTIKSVFAGAWEFIRNIWGGVTGFFSGIGNGIANIFNNAVNGIRNAFGNAVNWIRGLPGQILGALGNLGNLLWDSGWSLIMGLWNGINHAFGNVKNWVGGKLRDLRNLFPFSPAKEGPFSGHGYTSYSGLALMTDFGKGILSGGTSAISSTEGIVSSIASSFGSLNGSSFSANLEGSVTGLDGNVISAPANISQGDQDNQASQGGKTITQTNYNYYPTDTEQALRDLSWRLAN